MLQNRNMLQTNKSEIVQGLEAAQPIQHPSSVAPKMLTHKLIKTTQRLLPRHGRVLASPAALRQCNTTTSRRMETPAPFLGLCSRHAPQITGGLGASRRNRCDQAFAPNPKWNSQPNQRRARQSPIAMRRPLVPSPRRSRLATWPRSALCVCVCVCVCARVCCALGVGLKNQSSNNPITKNQKPNDLHTLSTAAMVQCSSPRSL